MRVRAYPQQKHPQELIATSFELDFEQFPKSKGKYNAILALCGHSFSA